MHLDLIFFMSIYIVAWLTITFSVVSLIQFVYPAWKVHVLITFFYIVTSGVYVANASWHEWQITTGFAASAYSAVVFIKTIHRFKAATDKKVEELEKGT